LLAHSLFDSQFRVAGPGLIDLKESIVESPQMKTQDHLKAPAVTPGGETDQFDSLPTTPHRAFKGFNDSVDNINLEDIRDILPEDVWRDVQPEGFNDGEKPNDCLDTTFVDGDQKLYQTLDVIVEGEQESAASPLPSPPHRHNSVAQQLTFTKTNVEREDVESVTRSTKPSNTTEITEEVELELLSTEDCSSGTESLLGHTEDKERDASAHHDGSKRVVSDLYDPKYRYGPAITKRRRGARSVFSGEVSPGGRSYVEVAEAVVLTVLDAVRPSPNPPAFRVDASKTAGAADATQERAAGLGRRVRGALGYVLHTAISFMYTLFIQYPLDLLLAVLGLWWSATSAVLNVGMRGATWLFSVYVWWLFLPVRLLERGAVLAWQKVLLLAVQFLNTHPAAGADGADRHHSTGKHTIPTALNGHAHKH